MPVTPLACLEMVQILSQTTPPPRIGLVTGLIYVPLLCQCHWLQTRNFHHGRGNRWAGLFSYNPAWFRLSRACSWWPWRPTTEWGTDIVVGGHYHYQRNWASSFIVLEKHQRTLRNIYCLGQHAAHGRGGRVAEPQPGTGQCMGPAQDVGGGDEAGSIPGSQH